MTITLGFIQPTVGTNSPITANFPGFFNRQVNTLYFQVGAGNQGDVYIGEQGFNKTTKVGLIAVLRPPTINHLPDLAYNIPNVMNAFVLGSYEIANDQPSDGVQITALEA